MPQVTTVDKASEKSCEATGHPSECTEPVPGQVQRRETHNVTVTNASGVTRQVATIKSADMFFEKHSHDYVAEDGCHNDESHSLDPKVDKTASFTINKSPAYVVEDNVVSDPKTDSPVNIISSGINKSINNKQSMTIPKPLSVYSTLYNKRSEEGRTPPLGEFCMYSTVFKQ